MSDALGGTQAVQDFAIYTGLWVETEDGPVSVYADVVEYASSGSEPTAEIQGGLTIAASGALEADVIDASGKPIPSLRADFALLDAGESTRDSARAGLLEEFDLGEQPALADEFFSNERERGPLVVEIVTADYNVARTHAGPDDRVALDLSFLSGSGPGSSFGVAYLFGQTIPGDPGDEAGLTPTELFEYRWNRGLVRVVGEAGRGPIGGISKMPASGEAAAVSALAGPLVATGKEPDRQAVRAVGLSAQAVDTDESTDTDSAQLDRLIKELILAQIVGETLGSFNEEYWETVRQRLDESGQTTRDWGYTGRAYYPGVVEIVDLANRRVVYVTQSAAEDFWGQGGRVQDCPDRTLECLLNPEDIVGVTGPGELLREMAVGAALAKCTAAAAALNRQNGAAMDSASIEPPPTQDDSSEGDEPDANDDAGDDGDPDAPPPLSCGPIPGGGPDWPDTGVMYGDIHINTVDGKHYTNQAVGEFVAFDNGVAEVQIRTEPWPASPLDVSVATAFAVRIGDHEVSMHGDGTTWVDGERVEIERGQTIDVGDGQVLWWDQGWVVLWPDGTVFRAQITDVSQVGEVTPAEGASVGLLGDFDGVPDNDFFTRDGEVLDPDLDQDFEAFYEQYVDSWRITDEESAFRYADGETTATFTDRDFPRRPSSIEDLPAEDFALAEEVCAGIGVTQDAMLADCILDVGATGEAAFAYQAYLAQQSTPEIQSEEAETAAPTGGGGENTLAFGDTVIAFGANPPVVDPSAPAPSWTCEVADGVFTAIASYAESPTTNYELDIQYISPGNARGFDEAFRLIVRRNQVDFAWVQTIAEQFSDAIDSVVIEGQRLTADGVLYVNDPPTPGLGPVNPLPADAELTPFSLDASCG